MTATPTPYFAPWLADVAHRFGIALPRMASDNYLVVYAAEDVERELARVNEELGLRGRQRFRWPGRFCDWTCNGRRAAILFGVGTEYPDGFTLACMDLTPELEEEATERELLRVKAARMLRERLQPIAVQDLGDPFAADPLGEGER